MDVELVPLTRNDLKDFLIWAQDDEVTKFLAWDSYRSDSDALEFLVSIAEPHPWFHGYPLEGSDGRIDYPKSGKGYGMLPR